jgi:hypothetical protein
MRHDRFIGEDNVFVAQRIEIGGLLLRSPAKVATGIDAPMHPPSVTLACDAASTSSATSVFLISARYSAPISGRTASIRKWTRYFGPSSLRGGVLRRRIDWIFSMSVSSPTRVSVSLLPAWFSPSSAKR